MAGAAICFGVSVVGSALTIISLIGVTASSTFYYKKIGAKVEELKLRI